MIVVTGATGHLGSNLIPALLNGGHQVRVLVYDGEDASSLDRFKVERISGNVLKPESLERAFSGADAVLHCAAQISIIPGCYEKLYAVNVDGVRNVVQACLKCGVRKLVHLSSIEAIGNDFSGAVVDETLGFRPEHAMIDYGRTKAEGALVVMDAVRSYGLDASIISPVSIIGPNDVMPSAMGSMFLDYANGRLPAYVTGSFEFVDVRDVAQAILRAAEVGGTGENYLCSAGHLSTHRLMQMLANITGVAQPRLVIPVDLMYNLAWFVEKFYAAAGKEPVFTRGSMNILRSSLQVSNRKACKELGMRFRPHEISIRDQLACFDERGLIKKAGPLQAMRNGLLASYN